ncbi:hypothetical protein Hanom_Chr08g00759181 [Helianthus anomalus]
MIDEFMLYEDLPIGPKFFYLEQGQKNFWDFRRRPCSFRIEFFRHIRFRPPLLYFFLGIYVSDPPVGNLKLRHSWGVYLLRGNIFTFTVHWLHNIT